MLDTQDATRKSFEHYMRESGVKLGHVARKVDCHFTSLSHWRAGTRPLHADLHQRLVRYLVEQKVKL